MNEIFAVHYEGKLLDSTSYHTRKGRIYTTEGPAKSYISRVSKWLRKAKKESEIERYSVVRYVPEEIKE